MVSNSRGLFFVLLTLSSIILNGCSKSGRTNEKVHAGEYYSFQCASGNYKVLKVLLAEKNLIHVCFYNNTFKETPTKDVIPSLYYGKTLYYGEKQFPNAFFSIEDGRQAVGRKHVALTLENWEYWAPEYLSEGDVTSDELEAYEEWKNGDRFVSGVLIIPNN